MVLVGVKRALYPLSLTSKNYRFSIYTFFSFTHTTNKPTLARPIQMRKFTFFVILLFFLATDRQTKNKKKIDESKQLYYTSYILVVAYLIVVLLILAVSRSVTIRGGRGGGSL